MNTHAQPQVPLLDLDLLRTLLAIADSGSFSAAAAQVLRTPSAISMQVKKIEDLLGRPVFIRDSRSVALTADGERLVEHARRMLALNRDVMAQFIDPGLVGEVRLGAPDDAVEGHLPDALKRFACTHPGVAVNVVIDGTSRLIERVNARQIDIAVISCQPGDSRAEPLFSEQLVWAMRKGGVAAEQNPIPISVWEEGCVWRKYATEGLEAQGRRYRVAFLSAHLAGQKAAILADLAIAPIPRSALGGDVIEARADLDLPPLPEYMRGMMVVDDPAPPVQAAADHLRASFANY